MSCPEAKARRSRVKDLRQGINAEKPVRFRKSNKPKKEKPWKVKGPRFWGGEPVIVYSGETEDQANRWLEKQRRSYIGNRGDDFWVEYCGR